MHTPPLSLDVVRRASALTLLVFMALLGVARGAQAQGALASASIAAASGDGQTSPLFGGAVSWRFNRALGIGVELTHARALASTFPHVYCCTSDDTSTRVTAFTTNVRLEIPTTSTRIIPFVVGGGGVAAVTQSYSVFYAQLTEALREVSGTLTNTVPVLPGPSTVDSTTTSLALTLGGGASLLLTDHVSLDADLRVLHIMGDTSRSLGRFGGGISYRF
jgi:opacity protein-like surface antigen